MDSGHLDIRTGQFDISPYDPQTLEYRVDVGDDVKTGDIELLPGVDNDEYYGTYGAGDVGKKAGRTLRSMD